MRKIRGWVMPEDDARSMLQRIAERIRSSDIEVEHRDVLIRLRSIIEEDLALRPPGSDPLPLSQPGAHMARGLIGAFVIAASIAASAGAPAEAKDPWKKYHKQQEKQAKAYHKFQRKQAKEWAKYERKQAREWERYERRAYPFGW